MVSLRVDVIKRKEVLYENYKLNNDYNEEKKKENLSQEKI